MQQQLGGSEAHRLFVGWFSVLKFLELFFGNFNSTLPVRSVKTTRECNNILNRETFVREVEQEYLYTCQEYISWLPKKMVHCVTIGDIYFRNQDFHTGQKVRCHQRILSISALNVIFYHSFTVFLYFKIVTTTIWAKSLIQSRLFYITSSSGATTCVVINEKSRCIAE